MIYSTRCSTKAQAPSSHLYDRNERPSRSRYALKTRNVRAPHFGQTSPGRFPFSIASRAAMRCSNSGTLAALSRVLFQSSQRSMTASKSLRLING